MSSTGEHDLCEVSATPRLSCGLWDKNRNYKVVHLGDSDHPFSCRHVYRCCTRNTGVVQLAKTTKQSQDFYYGLLQEGLSQKSSKVNRALHFASARIRAGIRVSSWPLLSRCPVLGQYGGSPGFSLQGRGEEHYKPKHPLSGTSCSQLSVLRESGKESIRFGTTTSRLG